MTKDQNSLQQQLVQQEANADTLGDNPVATHAQLGSRQGFETGQSGPVTANNRWPG